MNVTVYPHWSWFVLALSTTIVSVGATRRRTPFHPPTAAFASPYIPTMGDSSDVVITGQPPYSIASTDLSRRWIDLVRQDKVKATVQIPNDDGSNLSVNYGVRLVEKRTGVTVCEEFVEEAGLEPGEPNRSNLVKSINETLASFQQTDTSSGGSPVKFIVRGKFAAQLQLVRTLRPAPSAGFDGATTSVPPSYDSSVDSFVTGPLRLDLRPKVASLSLEGMSTPWDVYHNISPADTRGHFLLLPTLADPKKNWRGQIFTCDDSIDMVHLASSIQPAGSLFLGYNSVGGAASQNHIHCHAWPSPPIPLLELPPIGDEQENEIDDDEHEHDTGDLEDEFVHGWNCYPVTRLKSMYDFYDLDVSGSQVEVSYLKYPVFCVQLSASDKDLKLLGNALSATLAAIGDAPHNVGFLNRLQPLEGIEEPQIFTDVFVFARSKERSSLVPSLKLGISEMMGVFHAQSDDELQILGGMVSDHGETKLMMTKALSEISYMDEDALWNSIKHSLEGLTD